MKIRFTLAAAAATLTLSGCSTTYTFEATPVGVDEDAAENGYEGDPTRLDCFVIEADHDSDDAKDKQLGAYVRVGADPAACKGAEEQIKAEQKEDD